MKHVIPSHAIARQIGEAIVAADPDAIGFRVFQYEQPRTRLTLFGAAIQFGGGREQEIRFQ